MLLVNTNQSVLSVCGNKFATKSQTITLSHAVTMTAKQPKAGEMLNCVLFEDGKDETCYYCHTTGVQKGMRHDTVHELISSADLTTTRVTMRVVMCMSCLLASHDVAGQQEK